MASIRHDINGDSVEPDRNWKGSSIKLDWLNRKETAFLSIGSLEFAGETAKKIRKRALNGLFGGPGMFEGEPYNIEFGPEGSPVYTFKGYLDFVSEGTFIGENQVKVELKKKKGSDWMNEVADGFSFRYLKEIGQISTSDYVNVPYVKNFVPDETQLILLAISAFMMTKELIENVQSIADGISELINAATPNVGLGVTWDVGDVIWSVLKLVARIAYAIAIVVAIKNLIKEIFEQLIPKKRFHAGMTIEKLFEKGCNYLNLTLSSTLLNSVKDWVVIPSKEKEGTLSSSSYNSGVPRSQDGIDSFGDLIRVFSEVFNADFRIKDNVFEFERRDFWKGNPAFTIPDVYEDQDNRLKVFKHNANEMIRNYGIDWGYDAQDQNTVSNIEGMVFQAEAEPNTIINNDFLNMSGLEEINIPFSMGLKKVGLTRFEEEAKKLGKIVDKVTGVFGSGTSFESQITEREGSLLISSHQLTIPKIVQMSGSKLASNQRSKLSAESFWDRWHYINSFVPINGVHNQYWRYEGVKIKFCELDFLSLLESKEIVDSLGRKGELETLDWNPYQNTATINYRINELWTNNLKLKKVV